MSAIRRHWFAASVALALGLASPGARCADPPEGAASAASTPAAAPSTIQRTILNRIDVPGSSYEVIYALVEIPANSAVPRHTHPGTVIGYLLEGDYTMLISGQPPRTLRVGDTLEVPAGDVHEERAGARAAKLLVVFTVEKGKPLSSPSP